MEEQMYSVSREMETLKRNQKKIKVMTDEMD